jgi:hypothetical protein
MHIKIYSIYSIYCFGQCSPTADRRPNLSYLHNLYTHTQKPRRYNGFWERKLKRGCFREEKTVNMKKLNCSPEYKTGSTRNPATTKDPLQDPRCAQQNRESRRRQNTIRHVQGRLRRPENENAKVRASRKTVGCKPSLTRSGVSGLGRSHPTTPTNGIRTPPNGSLTTI